MKICIIIDDYLPDSIKVGAKMMHELAVEFVKRGHKVTVFTPHANLKNQSATTELNGVKVCYFRSGAVKNVGKIQRAINETLLSHNAWKTYKKFFCENSNDLIIYYSPSIFWGALIKKLSNLWNSPSYLILRDFFPQWVIDNKMIKEKSLIAKYFRYFERINYQAADVIAIQSPKNLEWFKDTSNLTKPLNLLYNWAANNPVKTSKAYYRTKYGLEEKVVFFYGGNIGIAQDMMNIVRLAKNLISEKKSHFVLVGKGDEYELVREAIEEQGLTNMSLLPPVSQDEFKLMLAEFDIGLFSLHRDHTTHNFPGKLLGYMVQSKPILGSVNNGNDLKDIVEEQGAGLISINGKDEELLKNAKILISNSDLRVNMGKKAHSLFQSAFSVETSVDNILNFYHHQVLKKDNNAS
jgi:glycosyltransferase involved in cell wall biosynthesis